SSTCRSAIHATSPCTSHRSSTSCARISASSSCSNTPRKRGNPQATPDRRSKPMNIDRRTFIKTGVALGVAAAGAPALAQSRTKIKLGYLHTLAVDGKIWTGIDQGHFARHGVEFEMLQFNTGLELFQAMIGGSIDMLSTGAVISNFPARGQGKMFLVNDIEFAT